MSLSKSGKATHDATVAIAESILQSAVAASTTQTATNTASIAFYRSVYASVVAMATIRSGKCRRSSSR
jgi:hypothetical protein